ncbi:hypothetical protein [Vitreimonas flagellata]|uniref:hypothetical protein n=1 Tax=Vitreimonas flagellata TaxID=2560861 RepID=UPI0010750C40|nr:hypothetical protein [Vitreimonas flagellata]
MSIVLRHNEQLELNRVEYSNSVTLAELTKLVEFQAANPTWLTFDALAIVTPGADFATIDKSALDKLYASYAELFSSLHFLILRRSAWICLSPAAEEHVRYWIGDRDTRETVSSDLRRFDTFPEAGDWLVLNQSAAAALENGTGFREIFSFHSPPARGFAR